MPKSSVCALFASHWRICEPWDRARVAIAKEVCCRVYNEIADRSGQPSSSQIVAVSLLRDEARARVDETYVEDHLTPALHEQPSPTASPCWAFT